jgi:hypothetical protein
LWWEGVRNVDGLFEEARRYIAVPDEVLKEARKRRDRIREIVEKNFATLRTFGSGSLAHGTQNDPLNDADAGVVLDRRVYEDLGPHGEGPRETVEEVRGLLRTELKKEYPDVRFYTGGHRAIRINFMEPIQPGAAHFTADLIVAVRRDEGGLWIPDLDEDGWDPSHPECHVKLVAERNKKTGSQFARIMRLAKHANAHHGKTIVSFNLLALGLETITEKAPLPEGLALLLRHAANGLDKGFTQDPAGVSGPINANVPRRKDAAKKFKYLAELAEEALQFDADGQAAHAQRNWSKVLPGAIDPPKDGNLEAEIAAGARKGNRWVFRGAGGMSVSSKPVGDAPPARAFGDKKPRTR